MKIVMIGDEDGIAYPHFACDVCGNPILDIRFGLVVWFTQQLEIGGMCDGYAVHKRECDKELQRRYGTRLNDGQSLELYRLGELTVGHPSRKEHGPVPLKSFPNAKINA